MFPPVSKPVSEVTHVTTVHALIPQSLLEAIRNLDTPLDDGLAELAAETVTKRLGLSTTVLAQIERYREAAHAAEPVSLAEAVAVFRLVGRRPDASLVFSDAGRRAARYAARSASGVKRGFRRLMPRAMRRRLGVRAAARVARRIFGVELRAHQGIHVRLDESLAVEADVAGDGCYFYSALFGELLRVTSGFEGAMVHERCISRGDQACEWKAAEAERYD